MVPEVVERLVCELWGTVTVREPDVEVMLEVYIRSGIGCKVLRIPGKWTVIEPETELRWSDAGMGEELEDV